MKPLSSIFFLVLAFTSGTAWSFTPDLIKGCEVIAEKRSSVRGMDSVNAAYCLGVLDGILTVTQKNQMPMQILDPCFSKRELAPAELAKDVVRILRERPEILEISRSSTTDRGGISAFIALAAAYPCKR